MSDSNISPEELVKSVVPDIASIKAEDVITIVNKANELGKAIEVGDYLATQRPDLEDEIEDAVGEALAQF